MLSGKFTAKDANQEFQNRLNILTILSDTELPEEKRNVVYASLGIEKNDFLRVSKGLMQKGYLTQEYWLTEMGQKYLAVLKLVDNHGKGDLPKSNNAILFRYPKMQEQDERCQAAKEDNSLPSDKMIYDLLCETLVLCKMSAVYSKTLLCQRLTCTSSELESCITEAKERNFISDWPLITKEGLNFIENHTQLSLPLPLECNDSIPTKTIRRL